jgi:hypothetical protein
MYKFKLIIIALLLVGTSAFADIPKTLNYQGRLMNTVGQPVIDGQYSVTFRLYTAASGGNMVWEEAQSVMSSNGYFNTILGNVTALISSMFSQPLWVGVQVGSVVEMSPRQQLGTSAYAMTVVDGAVTTEKIAGEAITTDKIQSKAVTNYWSHFNPDVGKTNSAIDEWKVVDTFTINSSGYPLLVNACFSYCGGNPGETYFRVKIADDFYGPKEEGNCVFSANSDHCSGSFTCIVENVPAGNHEVSFEWNHKAGSTSIMNYHDPLSITIIELKR